MTATVLVTGFEPFGGDAVNPSLDVLRELEGWSPRDGVRVTTQVLPTAFGRSFDVLVEAMRRERPIVVIALGLAASRTAVSVERVAINIDDARIADNDGAQPIDQPVVAGGPAGYFSTLPIKAIVAALREQGVPAEVSQAAGTFVCNHLFYRLLHRVQSMRQPVRAGFIHVPPLPQQSKPNAPFGGLPLATLALAVRTAITTSLDTTHDLSLPGGALY